MEISPVYTQALIEHGRFQLRPIQLSDVGMIAHYASDKRVARMSASIPHPLPPGLSEAFVKRAISHERGEDVWVIDGRKSGAAEFMGLVSLKRIDHAQSKLGLWIAPPYWSTHVGTDAVQTLLAANPLNNMTLFATVFQDNPVMAKVLTQNGFEYLGDAETFCVARNANVPTWTYTKKMTPR